MPRIIAIEPDPKRRRLLAMLVREHVKSELKIADSVAAAIALVDEKTPDVIIAPALLSPRDETTLMTYLKALDAPYVQLLTVPALDMLADTPRDERRRFAGWFSRRPEPMAPQYDRAMVGAQIVDAVTRARAAREEYAELLTQRAELEEIARSRGTALAVIGSLDAELRGATPDDVRRATAAFQGSSVEERRVARRRALDDLPWLSKIRLGDGLDVSLVNISTTGVLFESGSKFSPGSTAHLHLLGEGTSMFVPVRFIRSEISRIDALGVKYHAAAAFDKEIDLSGPRIVASEPATRPEALAQLLASAFARSTAEEPAHVQFALGVRQLVGARDVKLRVAATPTAGGRETLYFDVPGDDRARTVLQVTFDRNHDITPAEFTLLKAAAWLTAAALEFDTSADRPTLLLQEAVA
jgi:hypothetical protein